MASQESQANMSNDSMSKSHKKHKNKKDKKAGAKQQPQMNKPEAQVKQEPTTQIKQESEQVNKSSSPTTNQKQTAQVSQEPPTQSIQEAVPIENTEPSPKVTQQSVPIVNQEQPKLVNQESPKIVKEEPVPLVNPVPVPVVNQKPTPVVNQEPAPVVSQEPAPVISQELTPVVSQEPTPVVSQEPAPIVNQEPVPVPSQEPAPVKNSEPVSIVKKEPVPVVDQEAVPVVNQESKPITKKSSESKNPVIDYEDDDLSELEIASALLDQTYALDDVAEFDTPGGSSNEAYKNIMGLCSSTTENIKKSIYEILNSRENTDATEEDTTTVLQESLNQKMADFKKVISGCLDDDSAQASTSEHIEEVTNDFAEVSEMKEETLDEPLTDEKVVDIEEKSVSDAAEKSIDMPTDSNVEDQPKDVVGATPKNKTGKVAKNEKKSTADSTKATKSEDLSGKADAKATKVDEKKSDVSSSNTKPTTLPQTRETVKEATRYSISPDDERINRKHRSGSTKKRAEKTVEQVMRSLGNGPAEEKLQLLCKKHVEALEEFRLMEPRIKQLERQFLVQQREKESSQAELNRMILAKARLESLCREMQRQSRAIKEESLLRIREEEEKRKEVANKFQATLNDISSLMQENSKKNIALREENAQLATKLKGLVDNYEIWEQNMTKIVQQKELETQLAKAKHAKVNLLLKQETEKFLREKQSLLENLSELQKRCTVLTSNELQLRTELSDYTSKYEEFQSVLTNSSKVFSTFKNDMETTSKKIKKLEKETNVYKQKWESSNKALLDMISHKDKQDKDFSNAQQRISTLEKLCRALQAERNDLQNQLNLNSTNSAPATTSDVPSNATEADVV